MVQLRPLDECCALTNPIRKGRTHELENMFVARHGREGTLPNTLLRTRDRYRYPTATSGTQQKNNELDWNDRPLKEDA